MKGWRSKKNSPMHGSRLILCQASIAAVHPDPAAPDQAARAAKANADPMKRSPIKKAGQKDKVKVKDRLKGRIRADQPAPHSRMTAGRLRRPLRVQPNRQSKAPAGSQGMPLRQSIKQAPITAIKIKLLISAGPALHEANSKPKPLNQRQRLSMRQEKHPLLRRSLS